MSFCSRMLLFVYSGNYNGQDVTHATSGGCNSAVNFLTDGTCVSTGGGGANFSANWYAPTTTGIGPSYWVRATLLSGNAWSTGTMGTWLQISSTQQWNLSTGIQLKSNSTKFEIAADAGGSNIVYTGTITATADGT